MASAPEPPVPLTVNPANLVRRSLDLVKEAWNSNIVYVPPWTDPSWKDDPWSRAEAGWPIGDSILDVLRPANLPSDQGQKPTDYAQRFGVFPGRTDGRSCLSPTRSTTRSLPLPDTDTTVSGKQLFQDLEELAGDVDLDEFMNRAKHDPSNLGDRSFALKLYEELMKEEFWQGTLFSDMSMDELISGSHFEMGEYQSQLEGPLYRFFRKEKWHPSPYGHEAYGPINKWSFDGKDGSFNVHTSDEVWEALQPCLQLASRIVQMDDPFFRALQDPNNWYLVDPMLDERVPPTGQTLHPLYKYEMRKDRSESVANMTKTFPTSSFDPVECTHRVLERCLRVRIASCHNNYSASRSKMILGGWSIATNALGSGSEQLLNLSTETVWQLLSDNMSQTEKLMASFCLAVTLVHEFQHTWIRATVDWIANPELYGISTPQDVRYCKALKAILFPNSNVEGDEPLYKDDSMGEVGTAFERHVMGNSTFNAFCGHQYNCPLLLQHYSGMANCCEAAPAEDKILPKSRIVSKWTVYERHYYVQRLFRKDFWDVLAVRYGSSVLRYRTDMASRAFLSPDAFIEIDDISKLNFGSPADRTWLEIHIKRLRSSRFEILARYCTALLYDACRFEFMLRRFVKIADVWHFRNKVIYDGLANVLLIVLEARMYSISPRGTAQNAEPGMALAMSVFHTWLKVKNLLPKEKVNDVSSRRPTTFPEFYEAVASNGNAFYHDRIVKGLMEVGRLLDAERQLQESMLCELYQLPTELWKHYLEGFSGHSLVWAARCHRFCSYLRNISKELYLVDKDITHENDFQSRLKDWAEGFETIIDLLPSASNAERVTNNWQELLITVPMLRKSQRKPWERLFYLAKQAMLQLTGDGVKHMQEFKERYKRLLQLQDYKVIIPGKNSLEQGLAEHWAGLLGSMIDFEKEQRQMIELFGKRHAKTTMQRVQSEVMASREGERAALGRLASNFATRFKAKRRSKKFDKQHNAALRIRPEIEDYTKLRRDWKLRHRAHVVGQQAVETNQPHETGNGSADEAGQPAGGAGHAATQEGEGRIDQEDQPASGTAQSASPAVQGSIRGEDEPAGETDEAATQEETRASQETADETGSQAKAPVVQAQVTRPVIVRHPQPLTGTFGPFGAQNVLPYNGRQQGPAFFQNEQQAAVITTVEELAKQASSSVQNHFAPAGNVHRPVPRNVAIDGHSIIEELAMGTAQNIEMLEDGEANMRMLLEAALTVAQEGVERHAAGHLEALGAAAQTQHAAQENSDQERRMTAERDVDMMDVDPDLTEDDPDLTEDDSEADAVEGAYHLVDLCKKRA